MMLVAVKFLDELELKGSSGPITAFDRVSLGARRRRDADRDAISDP